VRIWDTETGGPQKALEGHTDSVRSVAFSHDGQRLASASDDKTVRIWDAETGAPQQTLEIGASLWALSFTPDGCNLTTEIGCIALDQPSHSIQTPSWSGYCVHADTSWITWNGNKVLWIPPEYRPVRSMARNQTVVIGCASGRVLLIGFKANVYKKEITV
jgi:WD40 repeat protein